MRHFISLLCLLFAVPSFAAGPFDGEITLDWWSNELSGSPFNDTLDAGTLSLRAEGWWDKKWGLHGGWDLTDLNAADFDDPKRFNLDLKRRLISPTDNSFIAAGLGWESLSLESGDSSNGLRLSLEGRLGIGGIAAFYGQSVWMPSLQSVNEIDNLSGLEFETGVVFDPLPFISLRAAYRSFTLDYDLSGKSGNTRSSGIILGTGIHW